MKENIIIVNANGHAIGTMDKLTAHQTGTLHRAFSVFIFNSKGQLLLQQRAFDKYHSGGLWTNTCCSHPRTGEMTAEAAHRRLREEMGMDCKLTELFEFSYRHEFENGLIENEYDHVFLGISDELPIPNPEEVADFRYTDVKLILSDLSENPDLYTAWFKLCLEKVVKAYAQIV